MQCRLPQALLIPVPSEKEGDVSEQAGWVPEHCATTLFLHRLCTAMHTLPAHHLLPS